MIRKKKIFIFLIAIIIVLVFNLPIPVRMKCSGVELYTKSEEYCREISYRINGWYSINVFSEDSFYGNIVIDDYPEYDSFSKKKYKVNISDRGALLNEDDAHLYGKLVSGFLLQQHFLFIGNYVWDDNVLMENESAGTRDSRIIIPNAADRTEAISYVREHFAYFSDVKGLADND